DFLAFLAFLAVHPLLPLAVITAPPCAGWGQGGSSAAARVCTPSLTRAAGRTSRAGARGDLVSWSVVRRPEDAVVRRCPVAPGAGLLGRLAAHRAAIRAGRAVDPAAVGVGRRWLDFHHQ